MCEVIERNRAEGRAEGIGSVNKLNAILIADRWFADLDIFGLLKNINKIWYIKKKEIFYNL